MEVSVGVDKLLIEGVELCYMFIPKGLLGCSHCFNSR